MPIPVGKMLDKFNGEFQLKLKNSLEIIQCAVDKYGAKHVALSFNGGKDCTVLLYLLAAILVDYKYPIRTLYIKSYDSFDEITEFVDKCVLEYNLNMETYMADMKSGLELFLRSNPVTKCILIGTRIDDPFSSNLKSFQETDNGWPKIMRVHPILDWSYHDVWTFLLTLQLPYCSLYDQGYTSLGGKNNTIHNPLLKNPDGPGYFPAYRLSDPLTERHGRNKK